MNYIIEGADKEKRISTAISLGSTVEIYPREKPKDETLGIDLIRELKSELKLKTNTEKVILIEDAQRLTVPAQNAFLKLLEEPPANISFCLCVQNFHSLLPTIISRCAIIKLGNKESIKENEENKQIAKEFLNIVSANFAQKISYKNSIKKELKDGSAKDYFFVWAAVLKDALSIKSGVGEREVIFVSLESEIKKAFEAFSLADLIRVNKKTSEYIDLANETNVGADKIASVFLLNM